MSFVGRKLLYRYDSGLEVKGYFETASSLAWEALSGPAKGLKGVETIYATEVAPSVHFISWLENNGVTVSQVLDLEKMTVSAFITFETGEGRQCLFDKGSVDDFDQ